MADKNTAALLVEVAKKELGTIEGPKDNETKYGKFTKVNFQPWCGSFVMWCADQAGVKVPNTVYTPAGAASFEKMGAWIDAKSGESPQPGDILFFDFPEDGVNRISHVGICIKAGRDGLCTTIEGNTSGTAKGDQRNGGMVAEKVRGYAKNKKGIQVSIVGWGRPKFASNTSTSEKPFDTDSVVEIYCDYLES